MFFWFKRYIPGFFLSLLLFFAAYSVQGQIYSNDFEGGGIGGTTSFTGGATGDPGLDIAASTWSTDGLFTTFVGTSPTPATSMALQPGTALTTTWTLNVPVNPGFTANITSLDLDYRSTSTSYNTLSITINGTSVYSGPAFTDASFHHLSFTGLSITGITSSISMVSVMSGGSHGGSSTFRYDNVSINGTVVPANNPPSFTNGPVQSLSVCENGAYSLDAVLAVDDIDVGQTETWSVSSAPLNGTLTGFNALGMSTGGTILPGGLMYTPVPGYSGPDAFTIQVSDGVATATTVINVTVIPAPPAITGGLSVCMGSTSTLSNAAVGGTWSSGDLSVATVTSTTGVVSGVATGFAPITYTSNVTGCATVATIAVAAGPSAIAGPVGLCTGSTILLTNSVPGGNWTSANTAVATIDNSGVVSGISSGTTDISYTVGSCSTGLSITVTTIPPITGNPNLCAGATTMLYNAAPGGAWTSQNPGVASVNGAGLVTGILSGTAVIQYGVGACYSSVLVSVGFAISPITGADSVCGGATVSLVNPSPGGNWSCSNTLVATVSGGGTVKGLTQGPVTISYTVGSCSETHDVFVKAGSAGVILGKDSVCRGPGHEMQLSDVIAGGVWTSSNTNQATVDPVTGVVTGVNTGYDTIRYTVTSTCGKFIARKLIYVRTYKQCITGADDLVGVQVPELKVFPNPNDGTCSMSLFTEESDDIHVVITNIVGSKVLEFETRSGETRDIRIPGPAGIYILMADVGAKRYITRVVVN